MMMMMPVGPRKKVWLMQTDRQSDRQTDGYTTLAASWFFCFCCFLSPLRSPPVSTFPLFSSSSCCPTLSLSISSLVFPRVSSVVSFQLFFILSLSGSGSICLPASRHFRLILSISLLLSTTAASHSDYRCLCCWLTVDDSTPFILFTVLRYLVSSCLACLRVCLPPLGSIPHFYCHSLFPFSLSFFSILSLSLSLFLFFRFSNSHSLLTSLLFNLI